MKIITSIFFKIILLIALMLSSTTNYAQKLEFKKIDTLIEQGKNYSALKILEEYQKRNVSVYDLGQIYYYIAKANDNENHQDEAFKYFIKARTQFIKTDSIEKAMWVNIDIGESLGLVNSNSETQFKYIKTSIDYALKNKKYKLAALAYQKYAMEFLFKANDGFGNKKELIKQGQLNLYKAKYYNSLANDDATLYNIYYSIIKLHNILLHNQDSALFYVEKSYALAKLKNNTYDIFTSLVNKAEVYKHQKKHIKAIEVLKMANELPIAKYVNKSRSVNFLFLSGNYRRIGDYKNAYYALDSCHILLDKDNYDEQAVRMNEQEIRFKTQEKVIENLSLKNKLQKTQLITYSILALLFVGLLVGILALKNISKKRKITVQEKLIETQKLEKTLKEQELHQIDLMLETQEKERQNIANELHDNLGSMLATLKLNFQNLKRNEDKIDVNDNLLYEKTDELIEETYQKVRNIAHLKNLGVIGNQGLLLSVKKMAEKMSVLEKIKFNVIPFGLEERLENKLEVTLFRMIQELCTNIIKYANATEVNIYLTQNDGEDINIMIEDNGKGFDPKKIIQKDGIGLPTIERKVEQMGGTFNIDSVISKGTTIIIDIPL